MRYSLRNKQKIAAAYSEDYLNKHIIASLDKYFTQSDEQITDDAMAADGFMYGKLYNFLFYAIPYSMDDKRPGSFSAIFVEYATSSKDLKEAIMSDCELRVRFSKRYPKEDEI